MFILEYLYSLSLSQLFLHAAALLLVAVLIALILPSGSKNKSNKVSNDNKSKNQRNKKKPYPHAKAKDQPNEEKKPGFFKRMFSKAPHDSAFDFLKSKEDQAINGFTHPKATDHVRELVKATPESAVKGPDTTELNSLFTTMIKAGAIERKNFLVTNFEHHYLEKLRIWFGYKYEIYCQVSVGSVVNIDPMVALPEFKDKAKKLKYGRSDRLTFAQKCHNMSFDFLLIEKATDRIVCAIELDDPTHLNEERKQRDKRLDKICIAANLPIFHITNIYQKPDIRRL